MTLSDHFLTASELLHKTLRLSEGETPFPWQEELLRRLASGTIPPALDIPTGLGKTAVMPIWLAARASGASLPRRLVYVVDRRAVVDQATEVAFELRSLVDSDLDLKTRLGLEANQSLSISTLRGKYVDNREWLEDPASPAIIVGTVDMIGSRLLFEGYGVSRKLRPYHAGLLGADALMVLDEAHLVPPFEKLLLAIAENHAEFGPSEGILRGVVPSFRLISLSATGRTLGREALGLTAADLSHPVVQKRLDAKKHLFLKPIELIKNDSAAAGQEAAEGVLTLAEALAREAWTLTDSGVRYTRIIIFCDSRKIAEQVERELSKLAQRGRHAGADPISIDTELFVGGRRVFERQEAKERLVDLGFIAGNHQCRDRAAFVIATSAAEVGIDLDADHMVCDLVAWERMVQRLGRVNRRGDGDANAVVVLEPEPEPNKKVQEAIGKQKRGEGLDATEHKLVAAFQAECARWKSCQAPFELLPMNDGAFEANPGALRTLKQRAASDPHVKRVLDEATSPVPLRPALTRALVDAWAMTSLSKHTGRPKIEPWLRGWIKDDQPQTQVVWRTYLPVRSGQKKPTRQEVEMYFEAASPHMSEVLETETFQVLEWLEERAKTLLRGVEGGRGTAAPPAGPARDDVVAFVLTRAGDLSHTLCLGNLVCDDKSDRQAWKKSLMATLAGSTLIVDARLAGLRKGLLCKNEDLPPCTADGPGDWLGAPATRFRIRSLGAGEAVVKDPDWRERLRFAVDISDDGEVVRWLVVDKWRHDASTEDDRSAADPQLLEEHQLWVEERACALARQLGLDAEYLEMLAIAARIHDQGKRTRRWQRAFNAPADGPYAKTKGPINHALLDGYRHELGSISHAQKDERLARLSDDLRDLALHLIAAHHGFARPVIGTRGCEDAPPSVLEERAFAIALRFAQLQRRWGPWGLAWWEALLRAADQQASRAAQQAGVV